MRQAVIAVLLITFFCAPVALQAAVDPALSPTPAAEATAPYRGKVLEKSAAGNAVSPFLFGDMDDNGSINVFDALMALRTAVQLEPLTAYTQSHGDVNSDGYINVFDALLILQKAVGLPIPLRPVSLATSGSFPYGASGTTLLDMAVGDFTNDGNLDLAVVTTSNNNVSVFMGDGAGAFGSKTDFPVGEGPHAVATGDLNNDGYLDLAVASPAPGSSWFTMPGTVSVLTGNGAGSFGPATSLGVGRFPVDLLIGNFTGGSEPDVVTANYYDFNVALLANGGTAGFAAAQSFSVENQPISLVAADFSRDGKLDLVVAGESEATVLLGTATGGFAPPSSYSCGSYTMSAAAGDLDGDGRLDLACANEVTGYITFGYITFLKGDGAGSFSTWKTVTVGLFPRSVAIADLNGDGILDLVVTTMFNGGRGSNEVFVLLGEGGGSFTAPVSVYTVYSIGIAEPEVAIADLNNDGKPDLLISDPEQRLMVIRLNATR